MSWALRSKVRSSYAELLSYGNTSFPHSLGPRSPWEPERLSLRLPPSLNCCDLFSALCV